ncbi:MAG: cell wall hydrolase, partial [Sphingopyxis sp.]|nr:cell wall hydrolase [Sphingopyxis sp.]
MTAATMLLLAEPGFASDLAADANLPALIAPSVETPVVAEQADLSIKADAPVDGIIENTDETPSPDSKPAPVSAESLAELVAANPRPAEMDPVLLCVAGTVY